MSRDPGMVNDNANITATNDVFSFDNLLVVIVLYEKKPEHSQSYISLRVALDELSVAKTDILIYDNSPESVTVDDENVVYVHDPRNSGVSYAYNEASKHARRTDKKWMLLLDQDTTLEKAFLEEAIKATGTHPDSVAFVPRMLDAKGLLSPFLFRMGRGHRIGECAGVLPLIKYRFINSGLLVRHSAFVAAGGYDERIPLDFSDIAFGERLWRRRVTDHFVVLNASLHHVFSDNESNSAEKALHRFRLFRNGALAMGKGSTGSRIIYLFHTFIRAGRLCAKYRDLRFFTLLFSGSK